MLDTSRARARFGFEARTGFEEGLARTIEWYVESLRPLKRSKRGVSSADGEVDAAPITRAA
jgi:dTDP-D-glucose 4,6-dehydratase